MNEPRSYIENYFTNRLSNLEQKEFEKRCMQDEKFAAEVAEYIAAREAIRQRLLEKKRSEWADEEVPITRRTPQPEAPLVKSTWRRFLPYVAAASLALVIALYFLFRSDSPQQLADRYLNTHYAQLSQTMDASADSLQQGIAAYNSKDYVKALQVFRDIDRADPGNIHAKKYIGLVYLMTRDFDKAIQQFDELAGIPGVYNNPGPFLKAAALLDRNNPGDKEKAKPLLEQVVKEKLEGSSEAEQWLKSW